MWNPRGQHRERESQAPRIPAGAELPGPWALPASRPARLWKGMLPWDACSQHQDVPKDSWGLISSVPSDL